MNLSIARCLAVWAVVSATAVVVVRWAAADVGLDGSFDQVLAGVSALAVIGCAAWAWVVTTVVVLGAARGVAWHPPGIPTWAGRVVMAACGVAVLAGAPAHATDASPGTGTDDTDGDRRTQSVDGLPFPDRATGAELPRARQTKHQPAPGPIDAPATAPATAPADGVVVRSGDSLWAIAEAQLSPGATNADLAAWADELYQLNSGVIGPDADLIQPGQHLRTPDGRRLP